MSALSPQIHVCASGIECLFGCVLSLPLFPLYLCTAVHPCLLGAAQVWICQCVIATVILAMLLLTDGL